MRGRLDEIRFFVQRRHTASLGFLEDPEFLSLSPTSLPNFGLVTAAPLAVHIEYI
jgi:hypothetical protein